VTYNGNLSAPVSAGTYQVAVEVYNGIQLPFRVPLGTYTIKKADISKVKIPTLRDMPWSGGPRGPSMIKITLDGVSLDTWGNATYKYGPNKNIGKGTVKLTGKENFTGTKTFSFKIVPGKNKVSKITTGAKQMKVTWSKVSKAYTITKYQVRYRVKGTTAWKTKTFSASTSSASIKDLKKGKQYQVQTRSYKTISGVKYPSAWSATKTSGKIK
jgi:hypothetical protein